MDASVGRAHRSSCGGSGNNRVFGEEMSPLAWLDTCFEGPRGIKSPPPVAEQRSLATTENDKDSASAEDVPERKGATTNAPIVLPACGKPRMTWTPLLSRNGNTLRWRRAIVRRGASQEHRRFKAQYRQICSVQPAYKWPLWVYGYVHTRYPQMRSHWGLSATRLSR